MREYKPKGIEQKWQKEWEKKGLFKVKEDAKRPKYYVLEMLPYPSGQLHMGHVRNYVIGDVVARYKAMQGFNVLHPIGWDAFGMPAENAAIKNKTHPAEWTFGNIKYMQGQLRMLGLSYDWGREVATCTPDYYVWEQMVFLRMYEKGIVTRKTALLNWCDVCKTVLANEQAEGGKCWRCDSMVEQRPMTQWFIRIPLYAEELLRDIDKELEGWPERVRSMQKLWIGKSEGALIKFQITNPKSETDRKFIEVFTTRPDTLYGATFMSLAAEHPLVEELSKGTPQDGKVKEFRERTARIGRMERLLGNYEKEGVFTGAYCINPVTGWEMPVYAANFVLMDYGTGAVMAVPAHDQRDFEFARKYNLPIKVVIRRNATNATNAKTKDTNAKTDSKMQNAKTDSQSTQDGLKSTQHKSTQDGLTDAKTDSRAETDISEAYEGTGILINSGEFSGTDSEEAKIAIINSLKKQGIGEQAVSYKLKDWCISRQRYWGAPIPIIYCEKCGTVPLPESDLPVTLPQNVPLTGKGGSPLAKVEKFVNCKCPKCKGKAKRETDTMDTFVESSWYFLRYCSPKFDKGPVDPKAAGYWMPVDQYIGGIEHAVGHLLYCRFYMKVLRDLGILQFSESNEPVKNLLTQGMVTLGGVAMSKSRGNVVPADAIVDKYGADTARLFILFASPPEKDLEWSDAGVEGAWRFLNRVWRFVENYHAGGEACRPAGAGEAPEHPGRNDGTDLEYWIHKTIKRVTDDIERFHFNTAISAIMEFVNFLYSCPTGAPACRRRGVETLILLISPFAPHMAEELWHILGHKESAAKGAWPKHDPAKIVEEKMTIVVQVNGRLRDKLEAAAGTGEDEIKGLAVSSERVRAFLEGREPKKVIYIKGRLVNIVV